MRVATVEPRPRPMAADPILDYRGWVQIGLVDEVRAHGAITVRRFDRDVVVWTDDAGVVHAVESPAAAGMAATPVPVALLGGVAFMYRWAPGDDRHRPLPPLLDDTVVREALVATDALRTVYRITFPTTLVSFLENAVDEAHFPTLHGSTVRDASACDLEVAEDGTMRCVVILQMETVPGRTTASRTDIVCPDPFNSRTRFTVLGRHHDLVALAGPIGDHSVEVLFVSQSSTAWGVLGRMLHGIVVRNEKRLMNEDVDVLATRTVRPRPILSDADGPILAVHRWMERFSATGPREERVH